MSCVRIYYHGFQVRIGSWRLILTGEQILTVSYTKTRLGLLIMAM